MEAPSTTACATRRHPPRRLMTPGRNLLGFFAWIAISFLAAAIGAGASADASSFYAELSRPSWAPPAWLFGPVWSVLYALMAVGAWLVWQRSGAPGAGRALLLFLAQLAANALWSWIFFAWRLGTLAFVEVVVLLGLVAATVRAFWRVRTLAGVLLLPYLAWVGFAAALTYAISRRNPGLLA